jgi:hypothetical protein
MSLDGEKETRGRDRGMESEEERQRGGLEAEIL